MTNPLRHLLERGVATLLVRGCGAVLLFGLHVVAGKYLGSAEYGQFSFVLAMATILAAVAALGVPTAMLRYVSQYSKLGETSLLKGLLLRLPLVPLASGVVLSLLVYALSKSGFVTANISVSLVWTAAVLPVFVIERLRRNLYTAFKRPIGSITPDELIRPLVLILCVWLLPIQLADSLLEIYIGTTVALAGVFLFDVYRRELKVLKTVDATYSMGTWMRTSLPMALGGLSLILMNKTDVTMLGILDDMESVGVYAAANRVSMLNQFVLGTIGLVVTPYLAAAFHSAQRSEFVSLLRKSRWWAIFFAAPLCFAMFLMPGQILGLFGSEYVQGDVMLRILVCGQLLNAAAGLVGSALLMAGRERDMAMGMLVVAGLNICLNLYAIPRWSGEGAAVVTAFCIILFNAWMLYKLSVLTSTMKEQV